MHLGSIDVLKRSVVLTAAATERQLVGFNNQPTGLNGRVKGVVMMAGEAGDAVAVTMIGSVDLPAGAVIAAGDELISDATGKPVPKGATENPNVFGVAETAAGAPGMTVSVLIR